MTQRTFKMITSIAGARHNGACQLLFDLPDNARLVAQREPENPKDRNAVAILQGLRRLGYVPAARAHVLARTMDLAGLVTVRAIYNRLDGRSPTVTIEFDH